MRFTEDIKVINKGLVMISQRFPENVRHFAIINDATYGNDSNLLIVSYVQIMPDDFVMQLHRF